MDDSVSVQQAHDHPNSPDSTPVSQMGAASNSKFTYGIATILVLILGLGGYYAWSQNRRNQREQSLESVTTTYPFHATTAPKPTLRPTDPIINGKKHYASKGMGLTFDYPSDWNVTEEFIGSSPTGKNESFLHVGQLTVSRYHADGPGGSGNLLFKEKILIDDHLAELEVFDFCWNETILGFSVNCGHLYGYIVVTIDEKDNYWNFSGLNIDSKADMQKEISLIKEILASIKFTDE